MPGVTSVGASNSLPIEATGINGASFAIESRPRAEKELPPVTMYQVVTAGFFETLGMPIVEGRAPTRADAVDGRSVVWVNKSFARQFLDNRVIGERIQLEGNWLEIVGVVGDVRTFGLREDVRPVAYLPLSAPVRSIALDVMHVVIRTTAVPASLASGLRPAVDRVDPSAPLIRIRTMEDIVESSLARMAFTMTLLVIAAVIALVLGLVGLLRRDQLCRQPADAGDRRTAGFGGAARSCAHNGASTRLERGACGCAPGTGRRLGSDEHHGIAVVRGVSPRPRHLRRGRAGAHGSKRGGNVSACPQSRRHRPAPGPARRGLRRERPRLGPVSRPNRERNSGTHFEPQAVNLLQTSSDEVPTGER